MMWLAQALLHYITGMCHDNGHKGCMSNNHQSPEPHHSRGSYSLKLQVFGWGDEEETAVPSTHQAWSHVRWTLDRF